MFLQLDSLYLEKLGIAIVHIAPEQFNKLQALIPDQESPVIGIEAEVINYAKAAANFTWGLQATNALNSHYTGAGVKLCILDTGLDLNHPDFKNRKIISQSFISGQSVQDILGHGTHCAGTSGGPLKSVNGQIPRYGIAHQTQLFIGKVLANNGTGSDLIWY